MVFPLAVKPTSRSHLRPHNSQLTKRHRSRQASPNDQPAIHIPYRLYALAYVDLSGKVQYQLPPSLRDLGHEIFPPHFEARFLQHAKNINRTAANANLIYNSGSRRPRSLSPPQKRQQLQRLRDKAPKEETDDESEGQDTNIHGNIHGIRIGDTEKMLAYYDEAFRAFHQINCRQIAKAYIKFIEPGKQAKHPYNGRRAVPGETNDPEKTKPDWWPADVIHREPDHLKRIPRVQLLIHIFRKLSHMGVTARKLKQAGEEAQRQCRPSEKADILDEIYRVREEEERFERGEIDAGTIIYVIKHKKMNQGAREDFEGAFSLGQQQNYTENVNCPCENGSNLADSDDEDTSMQMPSQTLPADNEILPLSIPVSLEPRFTPLDANDGKSNTENYPHGLSNFSREGQYMNPGSSGPEIQGRRYYSPSYWSTLPFQQSTYSPIDFGNGNAMIDSQNYMAHRPPTMPSAYGTPPLLNPYGAYTQFQTDSKLVFPPFFSQNL
ncbi:hypothetical protein AJ79_09693 [Helicocarpus griseus UAMH5409]|uniref:Subtelomeric hrmA-associated cluster protein AFUB-079030/YDR124W-like helical bundle domain-containing protein n=1 Tax=Helicocarpus griseus UAMH5409 TaxID=1447875 RepID=A0A2B7WHU3_9EURO|nr:hypothetical protein AJ79_09693 [Helicocarpus griseus UAMH5409]